MMKLLGSGELKSFISRRFIFYSLTFTVTLCFSVTAAAKGPNTSAIYRIKAIRQQLPSLSNTNKHPTKEPFSEQARIAFQKLFSVHKTLALEAGRLPAFQKDINEKDLTALFHFTSLIENATPEQKINLESLLKIGLQDYRQYSSPLEAILWLLGETEYDQGDKILQLPLKDLLDRAWNFSDQTKWGNYEMVTDRLNAPELVNYYQRIKFIYKSKKGKNDADVGDAHGLFVKNTGNCYDHAHFAAYCLKNAGYKISVVGVHPYKPQYHAVCQFEIDGKAYFIDNGRPDKFLRRGIMPKSEYKMYHDKKNLQKGKNTNDPVYLLQDNYGLALLYLMEQKDSVASLKSMCKALGISGYERKVKSKYLKALVKNGFITKPIPQKDRGSGFFSYTINKPLCARFKTERYHRPTNAAAKL